MAHDHRTVTPSPFVPGARVAIETQAGGWRSLMDFKEAFVEKVHRSGRFTLQGSPQQYRPYEPSDFQKYWHAGGAGQNYTRLRIWDDSTDAEIQSKMARATLYRRFHRARAAIERFEFDEKVTIKVVIALEVAASALKGSPTTASALLNAAPGTLPVVPNSVEAKSEVGGG